MNPFDPYQKTDISNVSIVISAMAARPADRATRRLLRR